jgi:hypothetical protein
MRSIAASLAALGPWQTLLAFVFLSCYASALGQFAGTRARWIVIVMAIFAGLGFVSLSDPWETGVILLALVPVGLSVFTAATWTLWKVLERSSPPAIHDVAVPLHLLRRRIPSTSVIHGLRARLRLPRQAHNDR